MITTTCELAGYPLPISPKHSAIVGATYKMNSPIGPLTWVVNDSQAASTFVYVPGEPRTFGVMVGYSL